MTQNIKPDTVQEPPWYKQFWPWFIIALPASAVVASFITLWIAISNPDPLVVDDGEYKRLNSGLKAHAPAQTTEKDQAGKSDPGN